MKKAFFVFSILLFLACSRNRIVTIQHLPQKNYKILLFAAGYCNPCREELPKIDEWYRRQSKSQAVVYLVGGPTPGSSATPEYAKQFQNDLNLIMRVTPDKYGRLYSRYYQGGGAVPATVITDLDNNTVKIFSPGVVTTEEIEEATQ